MTDEPPKFKPILGATPTKPIGRPWPKGVSGNPGGRPKTIHQVQELARQQTPLAIETLADIAENGNSEAARVAAAVALLDRAWGKPASVSEMNVNAQVMHTHTAPPAAVIRAMTDAEKLALVAASRALRAARQRALPPQSGSASSPPAGGQIVEAEIVEEDEEP